MPQRLHVIRTPSSDHFQHVGQQTLIVTASFSGGTTAPGTGVHARCHDRCTFSAAGGVPSGQDTPPARRAPERRSHSADMDDTVRAYIDAIGPESRPLFDRVHRLILEAHPDATIGLAYHIPAYRLGGRRLFVGAWKHGISLYGWARDRDAGFADRHPELLSGRGTIQLRPDQAMEISDDELRDLVRAALDS